MAEDEKKEDQVEETSQEQSEAPAEEAKEEVKEEPKAEPKAEETKEEPKEDKPKGEVPAKFKDLVKEIEKLSVLELSELVKVLEDHFGVSAAPVAMAAGPAAAGGGEEAAEEKSAYTVVLASAGDQKINVIKAVREITGLGLAESKAIVDGAPKTIKENMPKAEADEAKTKIEAAGGTVELK